MSELHTNDQLETKGLHQLADEQRISFGLQLGESSEEVRRAGAQVQVLTQSELCQKT